MAPKHTRGDPGNSDVPKRSPKVLPFSEKESMYRKNIVSMVSSTLCGFRHSLEVLAPSPVDKGGLLYISLNFLPGFPSSSFNNDLALYKKLKVIKTLDLMNTVHSPDKSVIFDQIQEMKCEVIRTFDMKVAQPL